MGSASAPRQRIRAPGDMTDGPAGSQWKEMMDKREAFKSNRPKVPPPPSSSSRGGGGGQGISSRMREMRIQTQGRGSRFDDNTSHQDTDQEWTALMARREASKQNRKEYPTLIYYKDDIPSMPRPPPDRSKVRGESKKSVRFKDDEDSMTRRLRSLDTTQGSKTCEQNKKGTQSTTEASGPSRKDVIFLKRGRGGR